LCSISDSHRLEQRHELSGQGAAAALDLQLNVPYRARPAIDDDVPSIRTVVRAAYQRYVPLMHREPAPMNADHAAQVRAGNVTVVDDDQSSIIGVMIAWIDGDSMYVDNLSVHPTAQGVGIGGALLRIAGDHGSANGCRRIWLYTNAVMSDNVGFYERWGFREFDRRRHEGFDRIFFERSLPSPDWAGRGASLICASSG
jgi:ribosomal protein S18 acetylase RimI-like enzyme